MAHTPDFVLFTQPLAAAVTCGQSAFTNAHSAFEKWPVFHLGLGFRVGAECLLTAYLLSSPAPFQATPVLSLPNRMVAVRESHPRGPGLSQSAVPGNSHAGPRTQAPPPGTSFCAMGPGGPEPNCTALQGEALSCDFPRTPSTALGRKEKGAGGAREGRREEEPGAGLSLRDPVPPWPSCQQRPGS